MKKFDLSVVIPVYDKAKVIMDNGKAIKFSRPHRSQKHYGPSADGFTRRFP